MKKYLEIGKIVAVHGIKGEVRVDYWCDEPEFFCGFEQLYISKNGEKTIDIQYAKPHKNQILMKIDGVDTPEMAQTYRNKILYIDRDDVELEDGCVFIQDLIGLDVVDSKNQRIYGKISDVSTYGASDIYTIIKGDREYLFPAADEFLVAVELQNGRVLINPIAGMFDDEAVNGDED